MFLTVRHYLDLVKRFSRRQSLDNNQQPGVKKLRACATIIEQAAGFTVAELLIVVAVVGILSALALQVGINRQQLVVTNSRQTIANAFREAQRLAIAQSAPVAITVRPNRVEIFIWQDLNRDRILDWVDDGDGLFETGEGEVQTALATRVFGRLEGVLGSGGAVQVVSPDPSDINSVNSGLTFDFLCFPGVPAIAGADPLVAQFTPAGFLVGADEQLCQARIYVGNSPVPLYTAQVNVDPGGQITSLDDR